MMLGAKFHIQLIIREFYRYYLSTYVANGGINTEHKQRSSSRDSPLANQHVRGIIRFVDIEEFMNSFEELD